MQSLVDTLFTDPLSRRFASSLYNDIANIATNADNVDIVKNEDNYTVYADVPGVTKRDLQLYLSKNGQRLYINAERSTLHETSKRRRTYSYQITIPYDALPDTINATLNDGVLQVTIKRTNNNQNYREAVQRVEIN